MNNQSQGPTNTCPSSASGDSSFPKWLAVILLMVVGIGLRLPLPQIRPMWADEAYSVAMAQQSLAEIWRICFEVEANPPGYYALLHLWTRVLPDSLLSLRILSNLIVAAAIIIAFFAMRRLVGEKAAWVTAALMTVSPFVCRLDEARNYSLMFLFGALALLVLAYAHRRRDWTAWLWAALVVIGGLYCSYSGLQVGLGLGLAMLWLFRRHVRQLALGLVVFLALIAVVSPPIVGGVKSAQVWAAYRHHPEPWPHLIQWGIRRSVQSGSGVLVGFHHHPWMELVALVALLAAFGLIISAARRGVRIDGRRLGQYAMLLAVVAFPGWLLWSGVSIANRTLLMTSAYYTSVVPALYALLALALAHGQRRAGWALAVAALTVAMVAGHGLRYYNATHQVDWAEIMGFIGERERPGDVIAVAPPYVHLQGRYHHRGPGAVTGVPADFDITRHRALSPEITLTADKLPSLIQRLSQFRRVWLIETRIERYDPDRTVYSALQQAGRHVDLGLTEAPGHLHGVISLFDMQSNAANEQR